MSGECSNHSDFVKSAQNTEKTVIRMEEQLKHALEETKNHIQQGSTYRLAIICSCIGLVGLLVGGIIKFSVMDYKVDRHEKKFEQVETQIYDLNYVRGRAEAMSETKK